jgi:kinesin family protein 5
MDSGSQNRKVAFTGMNERSSRSHSLFIIHLYQKNLKKDNTKQSKLYFVDLAGSEKVSKTNVMGQQL